MSGRATIRLGIGPHSSRFRFRILCLCLGLGFCFLCFSLDYFVFVFFSDFSALPLLVGWQEGHLARKKSMLPRMALLYRQYNGELAT